jgi:hypothetical protein
MVFATAQHDPRATVVRHARRHVALEGAQSHVSQLEVMPSRRRVGSRVKPAVFLESNGFAEKVGLSETHPLVARDSLNNYLTSETLSVPAGTRMDIESGNDIVPEIPEFYFTRPLAVSVPASLRLVPIWRYAIAIARYELLFRTMYETSDGADVPCDWK